MAKITEADFNLQIKSKQFKQAYFIYGEEKYLVDYYTKLITDKILSKNNNSFNLQNFYSCDLDIDDLYSAVESLPLMSQLKCVRIFNLDVEKESAETIKKLKDLISDIPDTTVLIISLTNLNIDLKRSSKWLSFIKFFEKYGDVLNLSIMSKLDLQRQLIKWAEKLSCNLSAKNAQVIIDKCGSNLLILKNELEKLCAYANKQEITLDIISKVAVENFEANVFELTKAIMFRNYNRAFEILNILFLKKEEPVTILSVLASNYLDIYRVKIAEYSGKSIYDVADIFDYKKKLFRLENVQKYFSNVSMETIRSSIELLVKTDAQLKSSKLDSKVLLEKLIIKLSVY